MRAVVTVIGRDKPGIISKISATMFQNEVNILDIQQNVLEDLFAMVMLVDISKCKVDFSVLKQQLDKDGEELGMKVFAMHEDIFNAMHRI